MSFSLIPKQLCRSIYDLNLEKLRSQGIRVLFADLDNTLARYSEREPSLELRRWKARLEEQGIVLFVLSNSRKATRADQFCTSLGMPENPSGGAFSGPWSAIRPHRRNAPS